MARTLIITAGETPQVVTETVWALAQRPRTWRPDRILLATTASAARCYRDGNEDRGVAPLLGDQGRLAALWASLWPDSPMPDVQTLVAARGGEPLPDLRSAEEVEQFAEMLLAEVAAITADEPGELHLSLAGGRKTMSFIAGQVMSLLGRPQDVLSHVLVEPATLERQPGFWWPGDGSPGSGDARVRLHEVPYLRARAWVEPERLGIKSGFAAAVDRTNRNLADGFTIDLGLRRLEVAGESLDLRPREAALIALVAIARKRGVQIQQHHAARNAGSAGASTISLGGDTDTVIALWAWLLEAASGPGALARSAVHESVRSEARARFAYSTDIGEPASRVRRKLRSRLSTRTAERVLDLKLLATRVAPAAIRILAPAELADDPDRPPEVEPGI